MFNLVYNGFCKGLWVIKTSSPMLKVGKLHSMIIEVISTSVSTSLFKGL